MADRSKTPIFTGDEAVREMKRLTRRTFLTGTAAGLLGAGGLVGLWYGKRDDDLPWLLRRNLEMNERLGRALFSETRLAPTFPPDQAQDLRTNGRVGLRSDLDATRWRLRVENEAAGQVGFDLTLAEVQALPRVEMVTEFKCVEGWSMIVQWTGARLSDLMVRYRLGTRSGRAPDPNGARADLVPYVSAETPLDTPRDRYYVGLDMPSALHPQTLLAYELNGVPLPPEHGAPLRLVCAVKYAYKNIKRLGVLRFVEQRPADYWAELGYDWYAGH